MLPTGIQRYYERFVPFLQRGHLARWSFVLDRITQLELPSQKLSDSELRKESLSLRYRVRSGEPLVRILPEAFALVREAGRRTLNMRHFDVQLLGGIAIFHQSIVEMQTGEGKTLTATLPLYLYALAGHGAMLATVNDYLAKRDAELMQPIYNSLGLKVGVVQEQMPSPDRRKAYQCDITYGTAKEFGFDFLRDRLLLRHIDEGNRDLFGKLFEYKSQGGKQQNAGGEQPVQREPFFALVDEADSILIDEASTPLIISAAPTGEEQLRAECYRWAASVANQFTETDDYEYDNEKKTVTLNQSGRRKVRVIMKPAALDEVGLYHLYDYVQQAVKVAREFFKDRQYVVRNGEIVIVDEFTGRLGEGRKWRDGIHQAVEAKEGVEVTIDTGQAARVTIQDYFLRFEHLAGMTGTAAASRRELQKIYRCNVVKVPTNKPPRRVQLPTKIFGSEGAKWEAIVDEITEVHEIGRPVLIGTRTIDKTEIISRLLTQRGIVHQVLNANRIAEEAAIIACAGERGKVTVSTNMAGRGTDIKLADAVTELGGLHVICTEMHESARIDRQLIGRCGRQGDPGTFRQYLSLEDELLEKAFGAKRAKRYRRRSEGEVTPTYQNLFQKAQHKVEVKNFRNRKIMLYYEKEQKKMQRQMGQDPYLD
ncbi:MAG: translocase [Planctomycetaceae bacterium]|jgi:preprotein translocase subunit SecA|nr:translocase [Planctomycetaceae bacterium]